MPRRRDGLETRERILQAAARRFAEFGFVNTTNSDIAKACGGVNHALISYYFGDKATLYRESWIFSHEKTIAKYPVDGGVPSGEPAVRRLRAIIRSAILQRSDPDCLDVDIVWHEISHPTGLLDDVYEKSVQAFRAVLREVVQEMFGDAISVEEQRLTVLEIFALCVVPVRQIQRLEGNPEYRFEPEKRIDHIYNFAMAGLADILRSRK